MGLIREIHVQGVVEFYAESIESGSVVSQNIWK
jgi:hypothetical protein